MDTRIDYSKASSVVMPAMLTLEKSIGQSGLDTVLLDLVRLRASQINGCAYCIDMHWKDLRNAGQSEQRLYGLDAWRESPYYTDRERAVLAWTEAVTRLDKGHVPDEVFEGVHKHFNDAELASLTLCIVAINGWNRLNVAFRTPAGSYQPAARRAAAPQQPGRTPQQPAATH